MDECHFQFAFLLDLSHLSIGQEQSTIFDITAIMTDWLIVQFPPLPLFIPVPETVDCHQRSHHNLMGKSLVICWAFHLVRPLLSHPTYSGSNLLVSTYDPRSNDQIPLLELKSFSDSSVLLLPVIELWHHHCIGFSKLQLLSYLSRIRSSFFFQELW